MNKLKVLKVEPKEIQGLTPNKDIILIRGQVEILGVKLFAGAIVIDDENGLEFRSETILTPDMNLYQNLHNQEAKVGDMFEIKKSSRIKGAKHIKNTFEVNKVETSDIEALNSIKTNLEAFDSSYYDNAEMVF